MVRFRLPLLIHCQHAIGSRRIAPVAYHAFPLVALYENPVAVHVIHPVARLAGGQSVNAQRQLIAGQTGAFIAVAALVVIGIELSVEIAEANDDAVVDAQGPVGLVVNPVLRILWRVAALV